MDADNFADNNYDNNEKIIAYLKKQIKILIGDVNYNYLTDGLNSLKKIKTGWILYFLAVLEHVRMKNSMNIF